MPQTPPSNPRKRFILGRAAQLRRQYPDLSPSQAVWWASNLHTYSHIGWDGKGRPAFMHREAHKVALMKAGVTCEPASPIRASYPFLRR
jgi:hypothetical protein